MVSLSSGAMKTYFLADRTTRQIESATVNKRFDPTARAIVSNHETDKQAEDNTTWLYEYKALLNSKLTTLTTSLSSAYTTDLDASMTSSLAVWGGNKNAMQGITGTRGSGADVQQDPGAARTAYAYFSTWTNTVGASFSGAADAWSGGDNTIAETAINGAITFNPETTTGTSLGTVVTQVGGTTSFISGGRSGTNVLLLDKLNLDLSKAEENYYDSDKDILSDLSVSFQTTAGGEDTLIGNNFQRTLWRFFSDRQNMDLIRFGLFNDLIIVGTSSLPTGSQVQGSISLNWNATDGSIDISQERFAAFYHS